MDHVEEHVRLGRLAVEEPLEGGLWQHQQERPLARGRGHRGRAAVDQALVPERQPGTRESDADAAAAADDDLLDGAVDRQVAGGRGRSLGDQRAARPGSGRSGRRSGIPTARASRRRGSSRAAARTCCPAARRTRARRGAGSASRRPRRRATARGCASWRRRRAQATSAMRRLSANAVGWRRETRAAKSARLSESRLAASVTRAVAECRPPSSNGISPSSSPRPTPATSTARSPGSRSETDTRPSTIMQHRARLVSLAPQDLARRHARGGAGPGRAPPAPPRGCPRGAGTVERKRRRRTCVVRHPGRESRSRARPG